MRRSDRSRALNVVVDANDREAAKTGQYQVASSWRCDEVAASIAFLVSPAAQFITGATLRIDGAQSLWGDTWQLPE